VSLAHLTEELRRHQAIVQAMASIEEAGMATITDLPDAASPALAAAYIREAGVPTLIVTSRRERADALATSLSEYLGENYQVGVWTSPDALPYEQLPTDLEAGVRRVQMLHEMLTDHDERHVWITSVSGLLQYLTPPAELSEMTVTLKTGGRYSVEDLHAWATRVGYETSPVVQEAGTIARRGGIVDIFPPGHEYPVRLDFFGDDIESIRRFDPHNQRSIERLNRVVLLPPSELPIWKLPQIADTIARLDQSTLRSEVRDDWRRRLDHMRDGTIGDSIDLFSGYLVPEKTTLLDYLSKHAAMILDHPEAVTMVAKQIESQARDLARTFRDSGELPKGLTRPFLATDHALDRIQHRAALRLGSTSTATDDAISAASIVDPNVFAGNLSAMVEALSARLEEGWSVAIATDQVDRLTEIVQEHGIYPRRFKGGAHAAPGAVEPGTLDIRPSNLLAGWAWPDAKVALWTDFEVFGFRKQTRKTGQRSATESRAFAQGLAPGEYVVHVDHGIAKFTGLVRMETGGIEREYLLLEYEKGDKLYVPVDQSDRVSRYSGGGVNPPLNRLGSGEWVRTKRKVRRAVREMAFELIQLYAYREAGRGFAFPSDTRWDQELADSFPYIETVDQAKAISAVTEDMESNEPMDRLVCGDVGFGKTEVAIRAAFKAVNAGKQVAVLVPTTVLALQHFTTFRERLAAFPVRVEMLSRLRSRKEQDDVLDGLSTGKVDIVIGTHRLVQRDVKFKDLGLVVVDEEQRFGVRHKEFLKQLRTEVDVLTMSATPIPRTLHMSLSGIRDISMIETAPQARLPIRTFVTAFEDHLIREVILRELDRGGQVFVVHNRVHDIDRLANRLRKIVPEARFGIGHGQMDEHVLEEVMLGFVRRDFDVLIATTIIESGVDIPNVNTIVIDNADTLGLTQLYQLRGRVGRSNHRAYAYLLHQPHKSLSEEAMERLETIQEATELGAGLRVAMRDLEIRGAGNMLGAEQSGHIATIGYELYVRLLSQAIEEVRTGTPAIEQGPVTLDLPITALIPVDYVADTELRLNLYRQIAAIQTLDEVEDLQDELRDRFGDFPEEVEHLFALIALRIRSAALGIDSVVERDREIVIRPVQTNLVNRKLLEARLGGALRITTNSLRIRLLDLTIPWQDALDAVLGEAERAIGPMAEAAAAD
jgi:transcription-repair coupling factor (superfamily II helicase)